MAQLTNQSDVKKMVSEIMRRVDQLIKAGNIDQSIREIIYAKQIDPSNIYIYAYEERLAYLKEEHEKNIKGERSRKETEQAARKRDEELRRHQEDERIHQEEAQNSELEQRAIQEKSLDIQTAEETLTSEKENVSRSALQTYARLLRDAWEKGTPSEEKRKMLTGFRSRNSIPAENLEELEQEIKYAAYGKAFRTACSNKGRILIQKSSLQQIRRTFAISDKESLEIETQILTEILNENESTTILAIDDDEKLLELISENLTSAGYRTMSLTTTDEAYALLNKWTPQLILCDINLQTSTMDGFSFYKKVRELEHLHEIPFIFLTGLMDEALIFKGKELGVDDYLTKPISAKYLLAIIKGKLKRYSLIRKKHN